MPGAELPAGTQEDAELLFMVEGAVNYGGRSLGEGTYMFLPNGAQLKTMRSEKGATFFSIALPLLADLAAAQQAPGMRHPLLRSHEAAA
jgi:hypothetical protein